MGMPIFGSLISSQINFKNLLPDFVGESEGPIDPRKRLAKEDVADKRSKKGFKRTGEEFQHLDPGQELEIRGFNEFQDSRRRAKRTTDALQATADQRGLGKALTKAGKDVNTSFDNAEASLGRRQKGLGLRLSARQQKSQTRQLGLARNLSRAKAVGDTRRGFASRASNLGQQAGGFENELFGVENAALTQVSNAAGVQKTTADSAIAQRETDRTAHQGTVIGIASSFFSSEELKHDHGHEGNLLEKLKKVRINRWQYKGDDKTHVGPFSEEFNREFGIDTDRPDMINVIDALGVTLGVVKELSEQVNG